MPTIRETIGRALGADRWTPVSELVRAHYGAEPTDARRVAVRRVVRQLEADGALVTRKSIEDWREVEKPRRRKLEWWEPCRGDETCQPCHYAVQLDPPGHYDGWRELPDWATDADRALERQHGSHTWRPRHAHPEPVEGSERTRPVPVHALYVARRDYAKRWEAERKAERKGRYTRIVAAATGQPDGF